MNDAMPRSIVFLVIVVNATTRWFLFFLFLLAAFGAVASRSLFAVFPIHQVNVGGDGNDTSETVELPYFVEQAESDLKRLSWQFRVPEGLRGVDVPALLIPQVTQGVSVRYQGALVYELPASDEAVYRNWHGPALIPLPAAVLSQASDNVIAVVQVGHLRGWMVPPMLVGNLNDLRPLFEAYQFIGVTLRHSIVFVCGLLGVFLIILGFKSGRRLYYFAGLIAVFWSAMIGMAFVREVDADHWHFWRGLLYLVTGWLIYFEIQFNCAIYEKRLKPVHDAALFFWMSLGGVVYFVAGRPAEKWLDETWTGLAVLAYTATVLWVIGIAIRRRDWWRGAPILLFLAISLAFSFHDHALHIGTLNVVLPTPEAGIWANLLGQPVYLAHMLLPFFLGMSIWLVGRQLVLIEQEQRQHTAQLSQVRDRMASDIHDGVGSRINLLLWGLQRRSMPPSTIEDELRRCVDELRFAINPPQAGVQTFRHALEALITRISDHLPPNMRLRYAPSWQEGASLPSDIGLHLYRAVHECLGNAIRHSGGNEVAIGVRQGQDGVEVTVSDNGTGIPGWDNQKQQQLERRPTALGLSGLQKRMAALGGRCVIESGAQGTCVRLRAPAQPAPVQTFR